jgi:hypothetical protein
VEVPGGLVAPFAEEAIVIEAAAAIMARRPRHKVQARNGDFIL